MSKLWLEPKRVLELKLRALSGLASRFILDSKSSWGWIWSRSWGRESKSLFEVRVEVDNWKWCRNWRDWRSRLGIDWEVEVEIRCGGGVEDLRLRGWGRGSGDGGLGDLYSLKKRATKLEFDITQAKMARYKYNVIFRLFKVVT